GGRTPTVKKSRGRTRRAEARQIATKQTSKRSRRCPVTAISTVAAVRVSALARATTSLPRLTPSQTRRTGSRPGERRGCPGRALTSLTGPPGELAPQAWSRGHRMRGRLVAARGAPRQRMDRAGRSHRRPDHADALEPVVGGVELLEAASSHE